MVRAVNHLGGGRIALSHLRADYIDPPLVIVEGTVTDSPAVVRKDGKVVDRFAGGTSAKFSWHVEERPSGWLLTNEQVLR